MTSNGSANETPRGTRAKELNNAETGGRNDIMTIILANGASYDFKERVALRRLSLEMRAEVGKRQQGRERGKNRTLRPADTPVLRGRGRALERAQPTSCATDHLPAGLVGEETADSVATHLPVLSG
jgi:hypothetical protein